MVGYACGTSGANTQSSTPSLSPKSTVNVTLTAGSASSGPFYLDGAYSVEFSITHSNELCLLAVYARAPGESVGTTLFSGTAFGFTGTFPEYRLAFAWDDAQFYDDNYTIVSESACEKVNVQLRSRNPVSVLPTASPTPAMSIVPTPTPSVVSIANGNICSFVKSTLVSRLANEGTMAFEFGRISLGQLGTVYSEWAEEVQAVVASNKEARASVKVEAGRLIALAERAVAAAKAGKKKAANDLAMSVWDSMKIYKVCATR